MKIRILSLLLFFFLGATAQEKKTAFSAMETSHIRVATPGLFSQSGQIELPLDSIPDTEYSFPLPGGKVISHYGRGQGRHSGIDIKTHAKDTIRSAFNGVVRMSKSYSAYGNVIVVRHGFGLETVYSHNSKKPCTLRRHGQSRTTHRVDRTYRTCLYRASALRDTCQRPAFRPQYHLQHEGTDLEQTAYRMLEKRELHHRKAAPGNRSEAIVKFKQAVKNTQWNYLSIQTFHYICKTFH